MSTSGDWLPRPRAAQIEMARRWKPLVVAQQTAWNIAPADVARLDAAIVSVALVWQNERGIRGEACAAASKAAAHLFGKKNFRRYAV